MAIPFDPVPVIVKACMNDPEEPLVSVLADGIM
jgi:hypothetical protein